MRNINDTKPKRYASERSDRNYVYGTRQREYDDILKNKNIKKKVVN